MDRLNAPHSFPFPLSPPNGNAPPSLAGCALFHTDVFPHPFYSPGIPARVEEGSTNEPLLSSSLDGEVLFLLPLCTALLSLPFHP